MIEEQKNEALPDASVTKEEDKNQALYNAFATHDLTLDGKVFIGVTSTKIYCRPTCSAHMPKYENCVFFRSAAEAEGAGFRPCLLCRPETAPLPMADDGRTSLAQRAAALLRACYTDPVGIDSLSHRLGCSQADIQEALEKEYGATPGQFLLTQRLHLAKSLLTDSTLLIARIAKAAGFDSEQELEASFKKNYRLVPANLHKKKRRHQPKLGGVIMAVCYRPPYDFRRLLHFFESRLLIGVEKVEDGAYLRTVRCRCDNGDTAYGWVRISNDSKKNSLIVELSESLVPSIPEVIERIRRQFDTDCEPFCIEEGLVSLGDAKADVIVEGTRVPGCFEPFETMCRAVIGQQITVNAANKIAARVVEAYGTPIDTGIEGLTSAFPTPEEILAFDDIEAALGVLGVIKTRSRVIASLAQLMTDGEIGPVDEGSPEEQMERLLAVKGIGPWTANYIAMRALGYTDAFLESDSGIAHALPELTPKERLALAEAWRPWRSYANIALWNSLSAQSVGNAKKGK